MTTHALVMFRFILRNRCSLDKSLVYDFKEDYTSWYAEGLPDLGELPVAAILDTEGQASGRFMSKNHYENLPMQYTDF